MTTTSPPSVKTTTYLLSDWDSKFVPYGGYLQSPWTAADVWVEESANGHFAPRNVAYILIDGPSMPQAFLTRIEGLEHLWYRPNLRTLRTSTETPSAAPVPSRLSPQQLYNAPKVTRSYPFLESYATPDGVFYRSSWGTDLVRFDGKALPAPLNSLELWTEVAPLGRAAPADLEGVVIDPYSYPQEVLVRIPGHENIWALPIPVSVSDHPEDPSSVAYRLRASASHHSNGVSSIMGSSDPAVNDLNRALRGAQCDVDCRCRISLAPRTEIGPYTIRGGWPRGFKDVKLDDSLGNGGPAVVISLTGKDARGTVSIEKADVTAHLVVRAFADPIEILTMGPEGGEIEGTTTLNGWQATHRWEGGQEGGGQHDQLGRKLVITASYPGGSNGSGGSPHA